MLVGRRKEGGRAQKGEKRRRKDGVPRSAGDDGDGESPPVARPEPPVAHRRCPRAGWADPDAARQKNGYRQL